MSKFQEIKADLKARGVKIRKTRTELKANQRQGLPADQAGLAVMSESYRYRHVAYSLLKGRTREEIEPKVRPGNELDEDLLGLWVAAYRQHLDIIAGTLSKGKPDPDKLYVIVDDSLPKVYAGVQATHAVAEYLRKNPGTAWKNGTLVVLKADFNTVRRYQSWGWIPFVEPDLGGRLTAVADFKPKYSPSELSLL